MNKNKLQEHTTKKERYALKAFLWGMAVAAVLIVPGLIIDKGRYFYYGDISFQIMPFFEHMVDAVRSGEFGWSWSTDLGSSFVGSYSFYNLGSPFFWILALFPSSATAYVYGPLTILKFGVSSLTAYSFLKRYAKNKNNAVIGAMLYAFSGAAMYNMVFHFIDAMALFPLMLAALDMYIYEKKKGLFALAAFLCALTNYYFFIGEVVFCLLYWIVRMAVKSYKMDARSVFYLFVEAILGTGMATFILLPTVYHIIGNTRAVQGGLNGADYWAYSTGYQYLNIFISFFMPPEIPDQALYISQYDHAWTSSTGYLPLFGMSGFFAIIFNKNKNKWIRVFYGICALFMFVPVLNSSFNLFTESEYTRWFFMLLLIMSLGSVTALEDPSTKWKKAIAADLVVMLAIIAIVGYTPYSFTTDYGVTLRKVGMFSFPDYFWVFSAVGIINVVLAALLIKAYKRNRTSFTRLSALIVTVSLLVTGGTYYMTLKWRMYPNETPADEGLYNDVSTLGIDDIGQWRLDIFTYDTYSAVMYDYDSLRQSTPDHVALAAVSSNEASKASSGDGIVYTADDNLPVSWKLYPFGSFHSVINSSIIKFYDGLGFERKTLSNLSQGMYGARSLVGSKYMFVHSDGALQPVDDSGELMLPGYKYLKSWEGFDIYENEYAVPIGTVYDKFMVSTEFEEIPPAYRHLVLVDTLVVESFEDIWKCVDVKMKQVSRDDYDFTREEYFTSCEERKADSAISFERTKNGFEAAISLDASDETDGRYVFFSVPYDRGWKAYVNGEKADIMTVDYGFMAVRVPTGQESKITFSYHTPGTIYGIATSVVCAIMLLIYAAIEKIRSQAEEEDEENSGDKDNAAEKLPTPNDDDLNPEDYENMSVFDIIKQTEQKNMMQVYNRVPVVLERGSGAVGYDIEDKKYIDFTSGIGVNALGFADGRWIEAVEKQLRSVQHTSNLYYNTTQIQLAELLCMKTGFSRVFFANSGAEANECAIKIARKYGSDKYGETHTHIITLENSFHGRTITTLAATGQDVFHKHFQPFTEGFSFAKANDMDSIKACTTDDTCAVMIELIQGEGGVNPLDKKFVTDLAAYCKEKDILLIVDEIQTGVGRTGKLYCYENFGIEPDVITSAKALSGGLPLSACLCNEKTKDVLTPGTNGTTFGGNPVACAGALKILDIIADDEFLADVAKKGEYMRSRIAEMKGVKEVRGMGLMIGIVLEKNNASEVLAKCAENGLLVLTAKGLIRLLPPLTIEQEDINEGLSILENSITNS